MNSTPLEIRAIIQKVPACRVTHTVDIDRLMQRYDADPASSHLGAVPRLLADKVAHEFAGQVLRETRYHRCSEPEGEVFSVSCYALTFEQLCSLMTDAFNAGLARRPKIEAVPYAHHEMLAALKEADEDFQREGFDPSGPYRAPIRKVIAKVEGKPC